MSYDIGVRWYGIELPLLNSLPGQYFRAHPALETMAGSSLNPQTFLKQLCTKQAHASSMQCARLHVHLAFIDQAQYGTEYFLNKSWIAFIFEI